MKFLRTLLLAIFVVAALAYVNVIIPRPQTTEAKTYNDDKGFLAQEFPCNQGNCVSTANVVKIAVNETPACTSGTLATLAGYKGGAWIKNESNDTYKFHVVWGSYFCPAHSTSPCTQGQNLGSNDFTLNPGDTTQTNSPARSESDLTCGVIQTDMSFQAWKKVGSDWVLALSYGNLGNPGASNATYTYCNTGKDCSAPSHMECQNNACTKVNGAGTSTCSSNADCQPQTHKACQDNACKVVAGPGADSCSNNLQCQAQTHKGCWQNACRVLRGPGPDTCSADSQCQTPQTHNVCQNMACVQVAGPGTSTCNTPADNSSECSHLTCQNNACTRVTGSGSNTCSSNADCQNQTHLACQNQACVSVAGGGNNSCSQDSDCITPTHHACQSQACVLVTGSGSDSCTQDSDCHVDTCSGTNCGNINITVEQHQQQQQQQAVLGASVAPASSATSLPSTGSGTEVLFGLLSLIPAGWKLRKLK